MEKKYKLTEESIDFFGRTLYRIEALKDFGDVKKGDKGGYVESEKNLSQKGNCWIYDNAKVFGRAVIYDDAKVFGNAKIYGEAFVRGNAKVCGNAQICGNAYVYNDAKVYGNAKVYGEVEVCGEARIKSMSDYLVFKNWWSSGRYFTWTRSNNMWKVGRFYGTGEELIAKVYEDSEISGREYKRVVDYVESILRDSK